MDVLCDAALSSLVRPLCRRGLLLPIRSPAPSSQSSCGANGNEKAKAFDLVHELSIVAQSIESTLSERID